MCQELSRLWPENRTICKQNKQVSNSTNLLFGRKERKGRNKQKNKKCQPERSTVKKIKLGEVSRSERGRSEKAALDEVVKCE